MKISDIRINGIQEPIGYAFPYVKVNWKVTETFAKRQKNASVQVYRMDGGERVLEYEKEGEALRFSGEKLPVTLRPMTRYFVQVRVTADTGEEAQGETFFETAKMDEPWQAVWISPALEDRFHPVFVREFHAPAQIAQARLYITGAGLYEAYLNGQRIGDEYLTPYCNDYSEGVQYQTYDVTRMLSAENKLEILTGNGWYKGRIGYEGKHEFFGDRFQVLAELHIRDEQGRKQVIGTDGSWSYRASEVLSSDNYDGETFDRLAFAGQENPLRPVETDCTQLPVKERYSLPVRIREELPVKEIIHTPAGETVLDFGQNFTGFVSFYSHLPEGTKVTFTCGEILQEGNFYHDNYRTAKTQFVYRSDGREEIVQPHFTFSGFRYLKLEGWPGEPDAKDFSGKALYSDLDVVSEFHSSSDKLNRLAANSLWGQKSNFVDMPTDCPQRDERLAWTGDAQVFSQTACYHMDARAFYRKFLLDLRIDQQKNGGAVAGYLPDIGDNPRGASVWGDAATFIPMNLYEHYADLEALKESYPLMKDWTDWIIGQDVEHGNRHLWDFGFHFGDWLAQDGITPQSFKGGTDDHFIASIYYYKSVIKTANAAKLLGLEQDCQDYCEKAEMIYRAILDEYFAPGGRLCIDTQTAYLLSLRFKVYRDKESVVRGLKQRLKRDCYKIKGGFVGATLMCQTLAENGMGDLAYYILFQEGFPGWFHCIDLGATTIWERWNSVLDDGRISGTGMNSLNHYSYGSVMEYVYRFIAGLQVTEPGFTSVRFAPQLNWRLSHVRYAYDSVSGKYVSEWKRNGDGSVTVRFEVPFGCSAVAVLPGSDREEVQLTAGVFEKTYMPVTDFRRKFTMDSRLEELAADPRAMDILRSQLPLAYGMALGGDGENLGLTLNEMKYMGFLGFRSDEVEKVGEKLVQLMAE